MRDVRFIETESRIMFTGTERRGNRELLFHGVRASVWGDGKDLGWMAGDGHTTA